VSQLLARIASAGICPNFLDMYQTFTCDEAPPQEWDVSEHDEENEAPAENGGRAPRKGRATRKGAAAAPAFQFVLMQYADGGDMEEACKALPGQAWAADKVRGLYFQMLFSVFVAQRELQLRHYDVKLVRDHPPSLLAPSPRTGPRPFCDRALRPCAPSPVRSSTSSS
jgi:hypothetical protein